MIITLFKTAILIAISTTFALCAELTLAQDDATSESYKLGAGDKINIRVYGEADLTVETTLSESGVINYPFLGEINAKNLTTGQLESMITDGLKGDYLIRPVVRVSINEYRPFFIDGEVKVPGGYPYQPGLTIGKAAALAQGFTERASKEKIFITRTRGGAELKFKADISTELLPGDIVTVEQRFF
ncbi:polysaccharide biosynthesis/export family protein [Microbulbifer marinus]|uniref:Polysaccharide export outer membrane protein n=1 Tax=Microbulbifer marinus TaxID=658218 RepID=A0A1H3YS90_9GAMM|nr:polysaccharide biosynthesis/export family protein [Microbulbifer marinus]SEA13904.1 polysaccharide export outer membrane protein [Microbulbifer marinus]